MASGFFIVIVFVADSFFLPCNRIVFNTDTAELFRAVLVGDKPLSALVKTPQGVWVDKAKLEGAAEEAQRRMEEAQKVEEEEDKFERSGFKSSFKRINPQAAPVAVAVAASASAPVAAGESVPLAVRSAFEDEDLDGEAMEDLDGEAMEDLDGEAM